MSTIENNKLIAEFLNKKYKDDYIVVGDWHKCTVNPSGDVWEKCKYHSDWNSLMEVVEKIEGFEDENRCAKYNFIIEQSFVEIIDNNNSDTLFFTDNDTKQISVYKACVEFIKFYNNKFVK